VTNFTLREYGILKRNCSMELNHSYEWCGEVLGLHSLKTNGLFVAQERLHVGN
jgi:hypothetical protein